MLMVGIPEGLQYVKAVHRLNGIARRWGRGNTEWVRWAPWHRYSNDLQADGEVPEGGPVEEEEQRRSQGDPNIIETREKAPRDFKITLEDVQKHGSTRGCQGCSSLYMNRGLQPHIAKCRERFRGLLRDSARVRNSEARKREFMERHNRRITVFQVVSCC